MRFISRFTQYKLTAIHERIERLVDGTVRQLAPGFMCEFKHGDLTAWERDYARSVFTWKGLPVSEGGQPLDPIDDLHRVSAFDTAAIKNPELRAKVEEALLAHHAFGRDFVLAEKPKLPAPWPGYDTLVTAKGVTVAQLAKKIAGKVAEDGYDPEQVIVYERENLNREPVIAALDERVAGQAEPEPAEGELVSA